MRLRAPVVVLQQGYAREHCARTLGDARIDLFSPKRRCPGQSRRGPCPADLAVWPTEKGPCSHVCSVGTGSFHCLCGGVLLSHRVSLAVPSALVGLASGFGMGPGVSPPPWPPQHYGLVPAALSIPVRGEGGGGSVNRIVDAGPAGGNTPQVLWYSRRAGRRGLDADASCAWGWVSPRPISTSPLSRLPGVHVWPIDPVVCGGP